MSHQDKKLRQSDRVRRTSVWMIVGVIVLIALLILWLTVADFSGDTDVAAAVTPLV